MKKIVCAILALSLLLSLVACGSGEIKAASQEQMDKYGFTAAQVDKTQNLAVSWNEGKDLKSVDIAVKYGDVSLGGITEEGAAGKTEFMARYGKYTLNIVFTEKNNKKYSLDFDVALAADKYVIAPISGSMPQLYFTLNLDEITNNGETPAFVWLARPDSWNWENLPKNVFMMPTAAREEVLTHNNYDRMMAATKAYIADLYAADPNSKFELYINDFNAYAYVDLLIGNGVPEENFYVTLLSDGGASYTAFNEAFNPDDAAFDADAKYAQMAQNLDAVYGEVKEAGAYTYDGDYTVSTDEFTQYCYVAAKEKTNVEWWVLRPRAGVLCSPDEDFINRVLKDEVSKAPYDAENSIIEERNFASPLTKMSDEQKTALKALYNFNNEMFEAADKQGKKAMMILGSWANAENEPDFAAYVNLVKKYYGDEFVYYYKGHPNTPTSTVPEKQTQLTELDLIDVESSINAELILFFYPDIYMCGYNSSTFMSVESEEMACAIFNMTKEAAAENEGTENYRDLIGLYLSRIEDTAAYAECTEADHEYFLIEYNNVETDLQYSIYDATADTIIDGPKA